MLRHLVLEYDAADNDGHGSGEIAGKAKGGGRSGNVAWADLCLEGDEGGLEVGSDT